METVENQTRPLFSGTGTATDLVRTAIKELRPDAILARPSTFPHYLRPEDFVHPVIIGNLGAGDEHLNPFKKKESHIRLVLNQSKEARNGSARSVAELTELLALMLGRRAHQGLALASHETTEHFHNQHRGVSRCETLEGGALVLLRFRATGQISASSAMESWYQAGHTLQPDAERE